MIMLSAIFVVLSLLITLAAYKFTNGLAARRSQIRFALVCLLVPACLIAFAAGVLFLTPPPSESEFALIDSGQLADPGPRSFVLAMTFGVWPAIIYFLVSIVLYLISSRSKSE
jgi:hypothetical protein